MLANGTDLRCIQQLPGRAKLDTAQVYTQVSIRPLKQVHTLTHPAQLKGEHDVVEEETHTMYYGGN